MNVLEINEEVWRTYTYKSESGEILAFGKWRKLGTSAEFHNHVSSRSKSTLVMTRRVFQLIKADMLRAGCTLVVVLDENKNVDATRLKYWKFMGFKMTGQAHGCTFAVMETTCPQYP